MCQLLSFRYKFHVIQFPKPCHFWVPKWVYSYLKRKRLRSTKVTFAYNTLTFKTNYCAPKNKYNFPCNTTMQHVLLQHNDIITWQIKKHIWNLLKNISQFQQSCKSVSFRLPTCLYTALTNIWSYPDASRFTTTGGWFFFLFYLTIFTLLTFFSQKMDLATQS
jgi:hypothetical protein